MAGDPVPDRPNIHSNACPWLKVPSSRRCAHEGAPKEFRISSWNPAGGLIIWYAQVFTEHPCLQDIRERDPWPAK